MKYAEFTDLCKQEWDALQHFNGCRGDVTMLLLTDDSRRELGRDILVSAPYWQIDPDIFGDSLRTMVNPITRSTVAVTGDARQDSAIVSYGPEWARVVKIRGVA